MKRQQMEGKRSLAADDGAKTDTRLTQPRSQPVLYELIDKDGKSVAKNRSPAFLGHLARDLWPDQEQDEDRTGAGWDCQVAGLRD